MFNKDKTDGNKKYKVNTSISIASSRKKWALGAGSVLFILFVYFITQTTKKDAGEEKAAAQGGSIQFSDPNSAEELWSALATKTLETISSDVSDIGKHVTSLTVELEKSQEELHKTQEELKSLQGNLSSQETTNQNLRQQMTMISKMMTSGDPSSVMPGTMIIDPETGGLISVDPVTGEVYTIDANTGAVTKLQGRHIDPTTLSQQQAFTMPGIQRDSNLPRPAPDAPQTGYQALSETNVFRRTVNPPQVDTADKFQRPLRSQQTTQAQSAVLGGQQGATATSEPAMPRLTAWAPPKLETTDAGADSKKFNYEKNPVLAFLPAGSFFSGTLLHGLDAGTGSHAQANPQPILVRVMGNAFLPNQYRYQIKSCFILGSAYGSLSSERAYIRTTRLSCMGNDGKAVITTPLRGYIVDSDGKLGLRGKLINRQGAKLAGALLAGFSSGLSSAFANSAGTTYFGVGGYEQTFDTQQAMQAAGFGGLAGASEQLAQFYLDAAKEIFPIISINSGRNITVTLEQGVSLQWVDTTQPYILEESMPNPVTLHGDGTVEQRSGSLSEFGM